MRKLIIFLTFFSVFCCLVACSTKKEGSLECFAMDTVITLKAYGKDVSPVLNAAADEIYRLDRLFSITDPQSDISILNAGGETISKDTASLLYAAYELSQQTDGAYDFTIAPLMRLWGWYSDTCSVPTDEAIRKKIASIGWNHVQLNDLKVSFQKQGMELDLGGIAKGYTANSVAALLRENGVESALLNLGGNICVLGSKPDGSPWVIGIDDPEQSGAYLATVSVSDCSVVTSGTYQRFFEQDGQIWHHLLDPETGYPVKNGLRLVTVICKDNTLSDGLSTALFVMGQDEAATFWRSGVYDFEAVFVGDDGSISITEGLEKTFSCDRLYEVIRQ